MKLHLPPRRFGPGDYAPYLLLAALIGAVIRQPLMAAALLFLVFPLAAAPVLFVAAAVGALIPVPKSWLGK